MTAIVVIAVHVLDDNFLQPQPGTQAADHLVSGLVPLSALLVCAIAYSSLRAGLRAAIAIPLGLFGIVAGLGEAVYYSLTAGTSGDDYTGLLALAGRLLLVGLGAATLWKTRRTDDRLHRRYLRRSLLAAVAVVGELHRSLPVRALLRLHARGARAGAAGQARRGLRERDLHDQRRPEAEGLVRALEERCGRDRVAPAAQAHRDPRGCSSGTATACSSSTAAARARATATRTRSAGRPTRTSTPRSRSSSGAPTSTETGSAASASPSAARRCSRPPPNQTASRRSSPTAPAPARSARTSQAGAKWAEIPTSLVVTAGTMLFSMLG